MNTTEKLIEVKFNKKVWKKTRMKIVDGTIKAITILAVFLLIECFVAMVEQWSVSGTPLYIAIGCLVWIGLLILYVCWIKY